MQFHGKKERILLPVRVADVADAIRRADSVEHSCFGHESRTFGCQKDTSKVLAVLIILQRVVPRPCCLRQFPARQPSCRLHVEILAHLPQKPLDGRKVLPQRVMNETGVTGPIEEGCPRRGKKHSPAVDFPQRRNLPLDFVRRQNIIRVQLLDIIALAEPERMVYCLRLPLVFDRRYEDVFLRKALAALVLFDPWIHRLPR